MAGLERDQVLKAINRGRPFIIKMAGGKKHRVTDRDKIALGKNNVIVVGKGDMPHVLPLLTVTGISYLKSSK